jgi:hypothetical protein
MKISLNDTKGAVVNRRSIDRERNEKGGAGRIHKATEQKFPAKPGGWRR